MGGFYTVLEGVCEEGMPGHRKHTYAGHQQMDALLEQSASLNQQAWQNHVFFPLKILCKIRIN
jgi:hypothetical protein